MTHNSTDAVRAVRNLLLACLGLGLLNGCSGEPSAGAISGVLQRQAEEAHKGRVEAVRNIMGEDAAARMDKDGPIPVNAKKIACKALSEKPGYQCDVEVTRTLPLLGEQTTLTSMRLVKGQDGWMVVE